jgi:transposase
MLSGHAAQRHVQGVGNRSFHIRLGQDAAEPPVAAAVRRLIVGDECHHLRDGWRILNAIFYVIRSGCAWRPLPHEFPPWQTAYHYFRLWRLDGTWLFLNTVLREQLRATIGRKP